MVGSAVLAFRRNMNLSVFSVLFIFFALSLAQKWGKEDHKHGWGRDRDKNHDRNKNHGWGHRNHSRDEDNDEEKSVFVQTSRGRIQGYVKRLPGLDPVNVFEASRGLSIMLYL